MTQVLVVDDSHFMRTVISDILEDGGFAVVDRATNGAEAVDLVERHDPDVVTMDVEMPEMDGIEAVEKIMDRHPVPILMLSAITTEGADATLDALDNGAVDVFAKPGGSLSTKLSARKDELVDAVGAAANADVSALRAGNGSARTHEVQTDLSTDEFLDNPTLVIGASTGGPGAVERIVAALPRVADFRVLVVQHMPDQFTERFANRLDAASEYDIREACDGDRLSTGEGLLARGDYHMRVNGYSSGYLRVTLDKGDRVHSVRPAIDVTMRSAAETVSGPLTGVVLTGMGADGAAGIEAIKQAGGRTLAQDEDSSVVFGIPARAIDTGCVDRVVSLDGLTDGILDSIRRDTRWTST